MNKKYLVGVLSAFPVKEEHRGIQVELIEAASEIEALAKHKVIVAEVESNEDLAEDLAESTHIKQIERILDCECIEFSIREFHGE